MLVDCRGTGGVIELYALLPLTEFKEMLERHKEEAILLIDTEDRHAREVAKQVLEGDTSNPVDHYTQELLEKGA